MLGVLLFFYLVGREAPEPLVPPPPPLPVLVASEGEPVGENDFFARFVFGTSPLFDPGPVDELPSIPSLTTDPAVLKELTAWAAATRPSERLEFRSSRFVYDEIFGRENRAIVTVTIDGQNICVETRPATVPADFINPARKTHKGHPFQVDTDDGEVVNWNGTTVEVLHNPSSSRVRIAVPPKYRTKSPFVHTPILCLRMLDPFQEFQPAERAKNFKVAFGPQNKPGTQLHLVMVGRSRKWHENFSTVEVILRAGTYEPVAMRWFDAVGHKEIVFVYDHVRRD